MTDTPLAGKVALVTGAAVRLGRVIAEDLARAGARVAIHYHRSAEAAAAMAREIGGGARAFPADLADPEQAQALPEQVVAAFGGIDLLVNSAAAFERTPLEELDLARWERMLRLNLTAPFLLCRAAAPTLRERQGQIVNIADVAAYLPWPGYAHYCTSKAGLVMLTRVLALELAPQVRVNGIAPGTVLPPEGADPTLLERLRQKIPLERFGTPEEIAQTVLFLAAGPATITGQVIAVDGGRLLYSGIS